MNNDTFKLVEFDKDNLEHLNFYKNLKDDPTIRMRFQGLLPALLQKGDGLLYRGFLVSIDDKLVGYIDISSYNEVDDAVYLRGAIDRNQRGHGYGKIMLSSVSDLVFRTYPYIKRIRLKIEMNNDASLFTAHSSNYKWDGQDYFSLNNPYYDPDSIKLK